MIDLRQLRQFIAVAELLHYRRAAARLNMAQPPLTAAIKRLEKEIGTELIRRTNRIEGLTPAGEVLLIEARRTIAQAERAVVLAQRAGRGQIGALRVGFVASAARDILPGTLQQFRAKHAPVALHLEEMTTAQQLAALHEDRIDVAFAVLPLRATNDVMVEELVDSELVAVLPATHPMAADRTVALADLAMEPWILFPARLGPGLHARIIEACTAAGFAPNVVQEATQMETIAGLAAAGLGVSVVPPSLANGITSGAAFRRLTGRGTPIGYQIALIFRVRCALVEAFVQCAKAAGLELVRNGRGRSALSGGAPNRISRSRAATKA